MWRHSAIPNPLPIFMQPCQAHIPSPCSHSGLPPHPHAAILSPFPILMQPYQSETKAPVRNHGAPESETVGLQSQKPWGSRVRNFMPPISWGLRVLRFGFRV